MEYCDFLDHIKGGMHFSFARYGDGEWNAIFEKEGANCDKHVYFKDLGQRLKNILISKPPYILGMQRTDMNLMGEQIKNFINLYELNDLKWVNAGVFHDQSKQNNLKPFFESFKDKPCILVGPDYMRQLTLIPIYHFIEIPKLNCWLKYEDTLKALITILNQVSDTRVLFCASMMANVLIDDLYNRYGNNISLIDIGSLFDPFVGRNTRKYHSIVKPL